MTDRIAELRALHEKALSARGQMEIIEASRDRDMKLLPHLHALLDCAEALRKVTQALDWHAHGRCRGIDDGPLLGTADAVALGVAALARLNGDS